MDDFRLEIAPRPEWMAFGACVDVATALFFDDRYERPDARVRRERRALRICGSCVVRAECRAFARSHREHGIWGGETEEERQRAGFGPAIVTSKRVADARHEYRESVR